MEAYVSMQPDFLDSMGDAPAEEIEEQVGQEDFVATPEDTDEEPEAEGADAAETVEKPADPAPTAEGDKKDGMVPLKAVQEERRKRQALEAQLRELQAKQEKAEPEKPVQFFENPEQYVNKAVSQVQQKFLDALEADVREQHEDYDEMAAVVMAAAQENPLLRHQVFQAANPARALYKLGKQLQQLEQMKDPEAFRAQVETEIRAKIMAEQQAEANKRKVVAESLPRDLSNGRSGADSGAPPVADPRRGDFANLF